MRSSMSVRRKPQARLQPRHNRDEMSRSVAALAVTIGHLRLDHH